MAKTAKLARDSIAGSDSARAVRADGSDRAAKRQTDVLRGRLACPGCKTPLEPSGSIGSSAGSSAGAPGQLRCYDCHLDFPLINNGGVTIPWMFPNPELAHLEWSARYRGYLQSISNEHNQLNRTLQDARLSKTGRQRIRKILRAKREHRQQIYSLIEPIGLDADDLVPAMTQLLENSLARNQGLMSYTDNVFRDWAWNNGENEALISGIEGLLAADTRASLGTVLTLGAGACRLAYDIHRQFDPPASVLLDLNPLLMSIGSRVIQGQDVSLFEFPIAPLDADSTAVPHQCTAPQQIDAAGSGNFRFVLGDATCPPFANGSVDTVVTPWLIDILPGDLREFLPQINQLLPVGGLWANTGTLAFFHGDPCCRYSEQEVLELVEKNGFDIVGIDHRTIPYLKSPHSAHGRTERILSFAARKRCDIPPRRTSTVVPEWILDTTLSVPSSPETTVASSTHLLAAQVLAAIDGKRSIRAITQLVSREYNLPIEECTLAVRRILMDNAAGGGMTQDR